MLFLSSRNSSACSATTALSSCASRRKSLTSPLVAARAVSPAKRGACRPPGTPWTKRNRGPRLCLHADTTRQCWTRPASHPARCGSSLQKNAVCGLHGGCSSRSAQTTIQGARISVSSPLLDGYDEPEILRSQTAKSVSQALMSDSIAELLSRLLGLDKDKEVIPGTTLSQLITRCYGYRSEIAHGSILAIDKNFSDERSQAEQL